MTSILTRGKELYGMVKREAAEQILSQALNLLSHTSEGNYRRLAGAFRRIANTEQQRLIADWLEGWMAEGHPGAPFLRRALRGLSPNCRKNYLAQIVVNLFFRNPYAFKKFQTENGFMPPALLLISPSMRCNYNCVGCYAGSYNWDDDLPPEVLDRLLTEAKGIGTRFFVFVGGEPFVYKPIWDIFKKHHDVAFHVYTNGSLIDEAAARRLAELGNVAPQLSLEGFKEMTDARRGPGAFDRVMRAMDLLREKGVPFAFSACVTRQNLEEITSDAFIDFLIEKGAILGWYFLYMPVGGDADLSLMPTPEERDHLRLATKHLRDTKPILLADFWGDSPLTGGCISGGRIYCHINHKGDVEPCIFCHFSPPGANIKETSLVQALKHPFFDHWRRMQPFSYNALRPCPIIDHPQILRTLVTTYGARPTHEGAENVISVLGGDLDKYAEQMSGIYSPEKWEQDYPWGGKWMEIMDFPVERVQQRRKGYEVSKARRWPCLPVG